MFTRTHTHTSNHTHTHTHTYTRTRTCAHAHAHTHTHTISHQKQTAALGWHLQKYFSHNHRQPRTLGVRMCVCVCAVGQRGSGEERCVLGPMMVCLERGCSVFARRY